ncbi:nucleotidyltransferase [Clostridia bacterium]|nr:nucleotidyltransferase [Clostridia bacterium]
MENTAVFAVPFCPDDINAMESAIINQVNMMIYTIDEIKKKITPLAVKHNLAAVYLFGSYARGEATKNSDIDIMIDRDGSDIKSALDMGGLFAEAEDEFGADNIDLITTGVLTSPYTTRMKPFFVTNIKKEQLKIYER